MCKIKLFSVVSVAMVQIGKFVKCTGEIDEI